MAALAASACILSLATSPTSPLAAAELKLDFGAIAAAIGDIAPRWSASADSRSDSEQGGAVRLLIFEAGTAQSAALVLHLPVPELAALEAVYSFAPLLPTSGRLEVRAVPGGLHIELHVAEPALVIDIACNAGACPPDAALPDIVWHSAGLEVDVVVGISGGITIRRLAIGGAFATSCARSWFPLNLFCEASGPTVAAAVAARAAELAKAREASSASGADVTKAGFLDRWRVGAIRADEAGVRVSFCITPQCP